MATFTNLEIIGNILPALRTLGAKQLPVRGAMRIRKIRKAFEEHWRDVEATRRELLKRHATLNEKGELITDKANNAIFDSDGMVAIEKQAAFAVEYQELLADTFEYDWKIDPEVCLGSKITIAANTLLGLGELLEEPAEDNEK